MASPNTNWVYDNGCVSESSRKALDRERKREMDKIRHGYRWIRLSERTKVLVPCDKDGKPTKEGLRIIGEMRKACV